MAIFDELMTSIRQKFSEKEANVLSDTIGRKWCW